MILLMRMMRMRTLMMMMSMIMIIDIIIMNWGCGSRVVVKFVNYDGDEYCTMAKQGLGKGCTWP